jgi:hypothetical protein
VGIRGEYDNPSHRTYVLGENYTGQDGLPERSSTTSARTGWTASFTSR